MQHPRKDRIADMKEKITKPENIGDLHIKLMLKNSQKYFIRLALVESALAAYFDILWDDANELRNKLELIVLSDDHLENAFVEVKTGEVTR